MCYIFFFYIFCCISLCLKDLKSTGLEVYAVSPDGNCLFRAFSYQLYGDESLYDEVRGRCIDFMVRQVNFVMEGNKRSRKRDGC